jgi:hypothetical protein
MKEGPGMAAADTSSVVKSFHSSSPTPNFCWKDVSHVGGKNYETEKTMTGRNHKVKQSSKMLLKIRA